jgi:flagellar basal-body rod modification protein FlgD
MTFNDIIATNSSTPVPKTSVASSSTALGQKDFLRLLTAQMKTQDPFDPVDNKEMLAQMAQFSSLAGLSEINDTLKLMLTKLDSVLQGQAAATGATTETSTTTPSTDTAGTETVPTAE